MGRGEIQSHIGAGEYSVKIKYAYRSRIAAKLAALTEQINKLEAQIIDPATDPEKLPILKLQKTAAQKLHDYYSVGMPEDPTVRAWCADLTEDLSGDANRPARERLSRHLVQRRRGDITTMLEDTPFPERLVRDETYTLTLTYYPSKPQETPDHDGPNGPDRADCRGADVDPAGSTGEDHD
jgi:hypothetical protein